MNSEPRDSTPAWPDELRVGDGGSRLTVRYEDGTSYCFTAEFLRVESPSAEVKGHGPGQEVTIAGKRNVKITNIEPVGKYAVRLIFSDGHSTGLYSWDYIHRLGHDQDALWSAYLSKLASEGHSRD
jgi:DUF971 family protein